MLTAAVPRPIPVLLAAALLLLPVVWLRSTPSRPAVQVWVAAHDQVYSQAINRHPSAAQSGQQSANVGIVRLSGRAMQVQLLTMFMGGRRDPGVPDIVQIEIKELAPYLRPPAAVIGLLPLDRYLDAPRVGGPWREQFLPARLATGMRSGQVFAVPFDVHPVALAWREDLWLEAGIRLDSVVTWPEFHRACERYEEFWRQQAGRGGEARRAFASKTTNSEQLRQLLLQRGVDVAAGERPNLTDQRVIDTVAFFARMTAGTRAIGSEEGEKTMDLLARVSSGEVGGFLCADWRAGMSRTLPGLRGTLRLRPLPIFDVGDAPTTTFGGQLLAITRACPDPDRAWQVLEHMLLSATAQRARRQFTSILPATPADWPAWEQSSDDGFFRGESSGRVFTRLAQRVPQRSAAPAALLAQEGLSTVLFKARHMVTAEPAQTGLSERQRADLLTAAITQWLTEAQAQVERRLAHEVF